MYTSKSVELIDKVKSHLKDIRTEKGFEESLVDAKEVAESPETDSVFLTESQVHSRKIKRQFDYRSQD